MLLLLIVLVLLFGGGGGYYGYSRWGTGGGLGGRRDGPAHRGDPVSARRLALTCLEQSEDGFGRALDQDKAIGKGGPGSAGVRVSDRRLGRTTAGAPPAQPRTIRTR
jgi:hypothetical protein